ncbi:hypothetical protein BH10ACI2_BH10ACI2_01940 [soil metagenome]
MFRSVPCPPCDPWLIPEKEFSPRIARKARNKTKGFDFQQDPILSNKQFDKIIFNINRVLTNYINKSQTKSILLAFVIALTLAFAGCRPADSGNKSDSRDLPKSAPKQASDLLPFGNPSNANAGDKDNYLLVHDSHILSYNNSRGTPNWVAWRTAKTDLGDSIPRPLFEPDQSLPDGFRRVQYYDYSGSGYDRGHMVPSADRFGDPQWHGQLFLMTNIVPQTGELNQFPWEKLESYARSLVSRGSEVYTVAGVYGEKGRIKNKVTIPTNCWKVIAVFPRGQNDAIDANTRIIVVDMPNVDGLRDADWRSYKTTVRAIEQKTGYDLFSDLPRNVQDKIENRVDEN